MQIVERGDTVVNAAELMFFSQRDGSRWRNQLDTAICTRAAMDWGKENGIVTSSCASHPVTPTVL